MNPSKLKGRQVLVRLLRSSRRKGKKIVFTNGCYDLLHPGHLRLLRFAKRQGDLLIVGLNSDRSVRALKGANRPIQSEKDRAELLSGLEAVDYVTIFGEKDPERLIRALRPDILIKGADWKGKEVVGAPFVRSYGGKVLSFPTVAGKSTTTLIQKICKGRGYGCDSNRSAST